MIVCEISVRKYRVESWHGIKTDGDCYVNVLLDGNKRGNSLL
jgi:hypothetical protein